MKQPITTSSKRLAYKQQEETTNTDQHHMQLSKTHQNTTTRSQHTSPTPPSPSPMPEMTVLLVLIFICCSVLCVCVCLSRCSKVYHSFHLPILFAEAEPLIPVQSAKVKSKATPNLSTPTRAEAAAGNFGVSCEEGRT